MFAHPFRYVFVVVLAAYAYINTVLCQVYHYFNIEIRWYHALLTIAMITLVSWEGNRWLERLFTNRLASTRKRMVNFGLFFAAGISLSAIFTVGWVAWIGQTFYGYRWPALSMPIKLNLIYAGLINLFFHLLHLIVFFFREYRLKETEAEALKHISVQAELQAIKNQINPHFLFNNLNVLSAMVIRENPKANRFIEEFAKVYRYILTSQHKELVELEQELAVIQPYVYLLNERYPGGLKVDIGIPVHHYTRYIIPVALQLLIENAIKHNIISSKKPLHIEVKTDESGMLTVRNNRQPRQPVNTSNRIGLSNIAKRYELVCGQKIHINESAEIFEVQVPLLQVN